MSKLHRDPLGILVVFFPRAREAGQVLAPVLHVDARDIIALLFQQRRRYRRVDPAGHADIDFFCHRLFYFNKFRRPSGFRHRGRR